MSALVYTPAAGTALFAVSLVWPVVRSWWPDWRKARNYRGRHRAGEALGSCNQQPRWDYATELWAHVGVT